MKDLGLKKIAFAAVVLVVLIGCASLPPARPIKDVASIAGRWKEKSGGTMEITREGTYHSLIGDRDTRGTMSIQDGKAINSNGTTYTLHEIEGKTIMQSTSRRGNVREWTRVQ